MKYVIKLTKLCEHEVVDRQELIQIRCSLADANKLVVALCLLREKLVDSFIILDSQRQKIEVLPIKKGTRAEVRRLADRVEICLSLTSLDMISNFYLVYLRDGFADVSHVDIEATNGGYITFFAEDVKPPMERSVLEDSLRKD